MGAIRAAWGALGYENSKLGYPTSNERCGLAGSGCYQSFQGGTIHWSPATGAHATWGAIRATWGALGYENSKLGYPTSNERCGLAGRGCYQGFQGGTIHWSPATGAHATWGAIRATWGALGYENGKLGYPTSNETCGLANAGCYQSSRAAPSTGHPVPAQQFPTREIPSSSQKSRSGLVPLAHADAVVPTLTLIPETPLVTLASGSIRCYRFGVKTKRIDISASRLADDRSW